MTHVCVELDDPADDLGREGGLLQVRQRLTCGWDQEACETMIHALW